MTARRIRRNLIIFISTGGAAGLCDALWGRTAAGCYAAGVVVGMVVATSAAIAGLRTRDRT